MKFKAGDNVWVVNPGFATGEPQVLSESNKTCGSLSVGGYFTVDELGLLFDDESLPTIVHINQTNFAALLVLYPHVLWEWPL